MIKPSWKRCSVPHTHRERERENQRVTGNGITVCLRTAFLNSMANFTAILVSQQVLSNHNEHLNVCTWSREHPFVVLSFGHLILLIIYKLNCTQELRARTSPWRRPAACVFVEYCHLNTVSTGIRFLTWFLFHSKVGGVQEKWTQRWQCAVRTSGSESIFWAAGHYGTTLFTFVWQVMVGLFLGNSVSDGINKSFKVNG